MEKSAIKAESREKKSAIKAESKGKNQQLRLKIKTTSNEGLVLKNQQLRLNQ